MRLKCLSAYSAALISGIFLLFTNTCNSQWLPQVSGTTYDLLAVHFINGFAGLIGSNSNNIPNMIGGEIIRTTNGGANWSRVLLDSGFRVKDFYFINPSTGYAVGGLYSVTAKLYKTTDAGLTWSDISPPNLYSHLFNIQFTGANTFFAGGVQGVYKSTDSGLNWEAVLNIPPIGSSWGKVYFFDANTGIYTGDTGKVHRTTNAGTSWTPVPLISQRLIRDFAPIDANSCILVGDSIIVRTFDRGVSWVNLLLPQNRPFYAVHFVNPSTGYMTGLVNVWKSTNSGLIWFPIQTSQYKRYYATYFLDQNTGYVVGDSGIVFKTTTGGVIGIEPVSTEIPKEYSLYQNFPNPFNPTTSIRFAIPQVAYVRLTVFDMLGKEVEVLVNENLSPATYELKWDAGKHSSGVYFYRLSTQDFQQVKKMSVIK
jgi:photosystem II stability/assembly factor-like uncharacterized protein